MERHYYFTTKSLTKSKQQPLNHWLLIYGLKQHASFVFCRSASLTYLNYPITKLFVCNICNKSLTRKGKLLAAINF